MTTLIGTRCKCGNTLSRGVLIRQEFPIRNCVNRSKDGLTVLSM